MTPTGPEARGRLDRVCLALFWALVAGVAAYAITFPIGDVVHHLVMDDAFYYLKTAQNTVLQGHVSFDGLHPATGFHPLWFWLLLPVYGLFRGHSEGALRCVLALQCLLAGVSGTLLWSLARRALRYPGAGALALSCLLFLRWPQTQVCGLESGLAVLLVCVNLRAWFCVPVDRWREAAALELLGAGTLLGLAVLARLDLFLLLLPVAWRALAAPAAGVARRGRLRVIGWVGAPVALLLGAAGLFYRAVDGHWVPISASLKTTVGDLSPAGAAANLAGNPEAVLGFLVALALLLGWLPREGRRAEGSARRNLTSALWILAAYAVIHFGYELAIVRWGVYPWHFIAYLPLLALGVPTLSESWIAPRGRPVRGWAAALLGAGIALTGALSYGPWYRQDWRLLYPGSMECASWANAHLPAGSRLAAVDAGTLGYFSRGPVVNLDGLANSWQYRESLEHGGVGGYLTRQGIEYLVVMSFASRERAFAAFMERPDSSSAVFVDHLRSSAIPIRRSQAVHALSLDNRFLAVVFRLPSAPPGAQGRGAATQHAMEASP